MKTLLHRPLTRLLVLVTSLVLSAPAGAGILDTAAVTDAVARGAILWDVRDSAAYRQGHLPGAVLVPEQDRILRLPTLREFNELAAVEKSLSDAGIDLGREIVVYGWRGGPAAYAAMAAVRYFGGRHVSVYHDGIDGWREAGRPVDTQDVRRPPVAVRIAPDTATTITTAELLGKLNTGIQIIDARTSAEYAGIDVRAPRGGHVPGAVNIPYEANWIDPEAGLKPARRQTTDTNGMALKNEADLRRLYAGLDPAKETIVYCQSGARASETVGVLQQIGFSKVRLYKPSWAGWAATPGTPVETAGTGPR